MASIFWTFFLQKGTYSNTRAVLLVGLLVSCQEVATPQNQLGQIDQSVVVVAIALPNGDPIKTVGTGFVFTYGEKLLVVTCRHICESEPEGLLVSVFPRPIRSEGRIAKPLLRMVEKGSWRFHRADNDCATYDLAVYVFGHVKYLKGGVKLWSLEVDHKSPDLTAGDEIFILGYPSSTLSSPMFKESSKPIPLTVVKAKHVAPTGTSKMTNYRKAVLQQHHAVVSRGGLEGMSGGIVVRIDGKNFHLLGIVTGQGDGKYSIQSPFISMSSQVRFVTYTSIDALYEILQGLKDE